MFAETSENLKHSTWHIPGSRSPSIESGDNYIYIWVCHSHYGCYELLYFVEYTAV
jgi:hypothetical protein